MNTKRNVFVWILYDFANSIAFITFFLYFAQWVVIDRGVADFYYNLTFTISALLLLATAPLIGSLLDKFWRRITGLRYSTFLITLFYGLCAIAAINDLEVWALVLFTLGSYFYLLSFTFYTPLINDISSPKKRGLVSGLGISANYLGQIFGLLLALPFANGAISFFNGAPRAETLLPAALITLALALPMLIFFKEPKKEKVQFSLVAESRKLFKESKTVLLSAAGIFLLSYFLFNDAVLTAANNFPIFVEQIWGVSDTVKTYILLGIMVTSVIGGTLSGLLADRLGRRRTLFLILGGWIVILPVLGLLTSFTLFVISTTIMGLWFGANWAVSRAMMADIAPAGQHNLTFSYFGIAERASSLIGPLVWGAVVSGLVPIGPNRYRIAVLAVTVFVLLGIIVLRFLKEKR